MQLIETKTLGAAAASIEFTSIPQTFTDVVMTCSIRDTSASVLNNFILRINGVSTNSTIRTLFGNGSSASTYSDTAIFAEGGANGNNSTANTFSNVQFYFPNYSGSTNKSVSIDSVTENNATLGLQAISAGLWSQTTAINSLGIVPNGVVNFVAGSTISLYGITKGSDGIVTTS
jgi:hypothetical protein